MAKDLITDQTANEMVAAACDEIERLRKLVSLLTAALMAAGVPAGTIERIAGIDGTDGV